MQLLTRLSNGDYFYFQRVKMVLYKKVENKSLLFKFTLSLYDKIY
jgi:hypothetical protein